MTPLVSIIMPCYNAERYIAQSIESVLAQTYYNWELLITDDGSTDQSVRIVTKYCMDDDRIKLLVPDTHNGIAKTRNLSISRAKGRFIAFLDSDDLWTENKLDTQVKFMTDNNIGFCYSDYELIDDNGRKRNKIIKNAGIMGYKDYAKNTIIGCSTVMLDRDIVGDTRMPLNNTSEDMALWLKIMRKGIRAYPIGEVLLQYRTTKFSASSKKIKAALDVWQVYRFNEKMSLIESIGNFVCYAYNAIKKRIL